jgi:hypothetical protein
VSIVLTDTQVLSALRQIAEENPEKVYVAPADMRDEWGSCYYVHRDDQGNESPGCIVGQVLHRLGVPLADLKEAETLGATAAVRLTTQGVSDNVSDFLRFVQQKQDRGVTWSKAVADALEDYNDIRGLSLTLPAVAEAAA